MTVTASLVNVLTSNGFLAFDQSVPEGKALLPYTWVGLAGTENWDVTEPDATPFAYNVDLEAWGPEVQEVADRTLQIRALLGNWNPGVFGQGRLAGINVDDQDEAYQYRNIEADDRLSVGTLRLTFVQYQEV